MLFSSTVLFGGMNSLNVVAGIAHDSVTVRYFSWERLIIMSSRTGTKAVSHTRLSLTVEVTLL